MEVLVGAKEVREGDEVVVHMGNVIPFDGVVTDGEAMVNQASLTGESEPVRRISENYVYAGTVVEEGELTILVKAVGGPPLRTRLCDDRGIPEVKVRA